MADEIRNSAVQQARAAGMTTTTHVAWVAPPEPIRILDHLGVQAPCIALYGQILPGATNFTRGHRNRLL